jgi:hypothetical protein
MNSVGDSFAWGFRDPGWAGKMLLQGLIALIPIVGWIAMTGWLMMAFENIRAGKNELPPAGFHLERGIAIFGVFLIYGVILQIPGWVLGTGSPLVGLGYLWGFLASLFLSYLVPSLIVHTYHHGFAGGMNVSGVWRLTRNNVSNSVAAGALIWVASIIGGLGLIVCIIGIIFTVSYENVIQAGVAAWLERVNAEPAPAPGRAPAA